MNVSEEPLGPRSAPARRLRKLTSKRSARDGEGVLVLEGHHAVAAALDAGAPVESVYVGPECDARGLELVDIALDRDVPVTRFAASVLEKVTDTVTPQPLVAVAPRPSHSLDDVPAEGLVIVLADVREPGNAGTIVRSAEAGGAAAVIFCQGAADPWSPKVVRATAGALFHVPVMKVGRPEEVLEVLAEQGWRRVGTEATRGRSYDEFDWSPPAALVLGNEAWGVPSEITSSIDEWVRIPMRGRSESLNVAMAASILVFEAQRQREGERP